MAALDASADSGINAACAAPGLILAAGEGNLSAVKLIMLEMQDPSAIAGALVAAAANAHGEVVDFLANSLGDLILAAFREKNFAALEFIVSRGHKVRPDLVDDAIAKGDGPMLEWLVDHCDNRHHVEAFFAAALQFNLSSLQSKLISRGYQMTAATMGLAVGLGFFAGVKGLRAQGCPWFGDAVFQAMMTDRREIFDWLLANHCPYDAEAVYCAIYSKGYPAAYPHFKEYVSELAKRGHKLTVGIITRACASGDKRAVLGLRSAGCPWNSSACTATAQHGHLDLLQELIKEQASLDLDGALAAAERSNQPSVVRFLTDLRAKSAGRKKPLYNKAPQPSVPAPAAAARRNPPAAAAAPAAKKVGVSAAAGGGGLAQSAEGKPQTPAKGAPAAPAPSAAGLGASLREASIDASDPLRHAAGDVASWAEGHPQLGREAVMKLVGRLFSPALAGTSEDMADAHSLAAFLRGQHSSALFLTLTLADGRGPLEAYAAALDCLTMRVTKAAMGDVDVSCAIQALCTVFADSCPSKELQDRGVGAGYSVPVSLIRLLTAQLKRREQQKAAGTRGGSCGSAEKASDCCLWALRNMTQESPSALQSVLDTCGVAVLLSCFRHAVLQATEPSRLIPVCAACDILSSLFFLLPAYLESSLGDQAPAAVMAILVSVLKKLAVLSASTKWGRSSVLLASIGADRAEEARAGKWATDGWVAASCSCLRAIANASALPSWQGFNDKAITEAMLHCLLFVASVGGGSPKLAISACAAIRNLLQCSKPTREARRACMEAKHVFVTADGMGVLAKLMGRHAKDDLVLREAMPAVLNATARCYEAKQALIEAGGMAPLALASQTVADSSEEVAVRSRLLAAIMREPAHRKAFMAEANKLMFPRAVMSDGSVRFGPRLGSRAPASTSASTSTSTSAS